MNSYRRLGIGAGLIAIAVSVVSVAVYLVFISSEPLPTAAEIALLCGFYAAKGLRWRH